MTLEEALKRAGYQDLRVEDQAIPEGATHATVVVDAEGGTTVSAHNSPPSLKVLQAAVGGYIEGLRSHPTPDGLYWSKVYINEEGRLTGLAPNPRSGIFYPELLMGPVCLVLSLTDTPLFCVSMCGICDECRDCS